MSTRISIIDIIATTVMMRIKNGVYLAVAVHFWTWVQHELYKKPNAVCMIVAEHAKTRCTIAP